MKRLVLVFLLLISLCFGCTTLEAKSVDKSDKKPKAIQTPETSVTKPIKKVDKGRFLGIRNNPSDFVDFECTIGAQLDFEVDEKLALEIGNAVLRSEEGDEFMESTIFIVYEVPEQNLFVISRFPDDDGDGGDISVAISKENGAILKIWMGE